MRRWGRFPVVGCLLVLVLAGCGVTGEAVSERGDLSDRAVRIEDFPVSGATRVPTQVAAFALNGLSGSDPAGNDPADCTPTRLDPEGSVVIQGLTAEGTSSFVYGIAYADDTVAQVEEQSKRCERVTSGGANAQTVISTEVLPAPPGKSGVDTTSIRRTLTTGGVEQPLTTSTLTLIAQRRQVRVLVQYRWPTAASIDPTAASGLDSLFTKAVAAAFG